MEMDLSEKMAVTGVVMLLLSCLILCITSPIDDYTIETTINIENGFTIVNYNNIVANNQMYKNTHTVMCDGTNLTFSQTIHTWYMILSIIGVVLLFCGIFLVCIGLVSKTW